MKIRVTKKPRSRKASVPLPNGELSLSAREHQTSHGQPVSPCEDLHVQIARRAYELHAEHGYQHGCALDDWLQAEQEILGQRKPGR